MGRNPGLECVLSMDDRNHVSPMEVVLRKADRRETVAKTNDAIDAGWKQVAVLARDED